MRDVRLTEKQLEHPVAKELKRVLERMVSAANVQDTEVVDLAQWLEARREHSEELAAIPHLSWILQVILADGEIEALEWQILRAEIDKILPVKPRERSVPPPLPIATCVRASVAEEEEEVDWCVIDTETSGLSAPIFAVEIAAQRMRGWEPTGEPFRILLNHDVELEPMAVATHGYTRAFLRRNGAAPIEAHAALARYVGGLSMVSHNLAYDFTRVLAPEWGRLRLPPVCYSGFCTIMLSRRCLPGIASASLGALSKEFGLGAPSHKASEDLRVTVRLITEVLVPRLRNIGLTSYSEVREFSRKTPLSACHKLHGKTEPSTAPRAKTPGSKARKFKAFLKTLTSDGGITNFEFAALQNWLESEGTASFEAARAADLVEDILSDGKVTADELARLNVELEKLAAE